MKCDVCEDRFGVSHDVMRERLKGSLFLTAKVLCGFKDLTNGLHRPICKYVEARLAKGENRLLIMIPRMHFKSSIFSVAFPVWWLINHPEQTILLAHASAEFSEKFLRMVMGVVYSPQFGHWFPELVPPKGTARERGTKMRRSVGEFDIRGRGNVPEASVTARGVRSTITGGHFNVHIFDDLVDLNISRSMADVQNAIDFHDYADPLFVDPESGVRIVVGTWWPGGFYEHLVSQKVYKRVVFGCYVDGRFEEFLHRTGVKWNTVKRGLPVFPERFSLEKLAEISAVMGPFKFTHQMLNRPAQDDIIRFSKDDLQFYELAAEGDAALYQGERIPFDQCVTTLTVDISTGEGSDESAITVVSYHRKSGRIFVRHAWSAVMLMQPLMDKILEIFTKFKPAVVGIEEVSTQKIFKQFLRHEMSRRDVRLPIMPIKVGARSKFERIIEGFQPFYANRQVYFLRDQQKLISQLTQMDTKLVGGKHTIGGKSPDLVDSLAMHVEFWNPPASSGRPLGSGLDSFPEDPDDDAMSDNRPSARRYGLECEVTG